MKRFLVFAVAAVLFAACSKDVLDEQQGIQNIVDEAPATLTVGFEGDDTRIQLNSAQKTVWTNGDLVSVFYRSNANQKWQYTGETGARTAELKRVYAGTASRDMDRVVIVYPYNEGYYINPSTYNVQASLPAVQTYLEDSYGLNGNIMISQGEYNQFSLKSVCGWLKLQLTGDGEKVKSITLRGNSGEQVAGELYINSADATSILASDSGASDDDSEAGGSLIFEDTILAEVTLDCGEGVELGAEATAFYIALPPQTFAKGLTVEITATNGLVMTKSTDKEVVIERNHIQPMTTFVYDGVRPQPNNEIWYTATKKVEPCYTDEFGATYVSNEWDSETGEGVITFEGDVTEIGYYAFYECDSLTSVTIPDSVTTIGDSAFDRCYSLTSVTIPDSVTTIGDSAFDECHRLTSITIPDGVTSIGYWAFYYCKSLTSITIPDGVTSIGDSAFSYCDSLTSVTIGDSVTTIGDSAFYYCKSLTSVTIPDSVMTIGGSAFWNCESLTSVTIGNSVKTIGNRAFCNCYSLTSVTIPDSVTTIGDYAFYWCDSLTSVTIPDSVTEIGERAFSSCDSLTSVTIGNSVTTIGERAFYNCESLKTVYCKPTTPPTGGYDMFSGNAEGRRIFVPASDDDSIINAYKEAYGWSDYADYIFEEE